MWLFLLSGSLEVGVKAFVLFFKNSSCVSFLFLFVCMTTAERWDERRERLCGDKSLTKSKDLDIVNEVLPVTSMGSVRPDLSCCMRIQKLRRLRGCNHGRLHFLRC